MGTWALSPNACPGRNSSGGASIWGQSPNPRCPRVPARTRGRGDLGTVPKSRPGREQFREAQDSGTRALSRRPRILAPRPRGQGRAGFGDSPQMPASPNPGVPGTRGRDAGIRARGDLGTRRARISGFGHSPGTASSNPRRGERRDAGTGTRAFEHGETRSPPRGSHGGAAPLCMRWPVG